MIVDTGVLVAAANRKDPAHSQCRDVLAGVAPLIVPAVVIAEATYLVARELGPQVEAALLRSLATDRYVIEAPTPTDLLRAAKLVEQYEDLPLGATDALVVALAERFGDPRIATLAVTSPSCARPWPSHLNSSRELGTGRRPSCSTPGYLCRPWPLGSAMRMGRPR